MKPTLRACALTLALTATFTWAQSQSNSNTSSSTTAGSARTGTTSSSTVTNPSTTATAAEAASTAPNATAPAVATSPAGSTPGTTVTPDVGATTTPPPTGTTPPPGMAPAARPIVPSRATDVSGTASSSASDVQGTAANPNAQVRSGSGLATAPQADVDQPAGTVAAETGPDGQRIGGGGSMAVGIPQQPGATPGTAAAPGGVTLGTSDPALTPNVGVSSTNTVAYLRAAELPQREAALSRVEAQLLETNRAVARLPQVPANLPVTSQVEFAAAMQELQAREAQLRISLQQAQQADEEQWVEARNRLAFDYDAFTNALLRARAAGNASPAATAVAE